ncbi:MAG: ATP-binding protein [Anaerolineae bacterium]|jgi:serine/threonine-protein kinase RsbW
MAELSLWAEPSDLVDIRHFVQQAGHDLGLDDAAIYALELAVDEACTNVIMHAYEGRGGRLELHIDIVDDHIEVVIRDWGQTFDPSAIPAPDVDAPLEQRPIGGVGLFLMRQMMDRVDFQFSETDGNTLTMAKRLHRRE